ALDENDLRRRRRSRAVQTLARVRRRSSRGGRPRASCTSPRGEPRFLLPHTAPTRPHPHGGAVWSDPDPHAIPATKRIRAVTTEAVERVNERLDEPVVERPRAPTRHSMGRTRDSHYGIQPVSAGPSRTHGPRRRVKHPCKSLSN